MIVSKHPGKGCCDVQVAKLLFEQIGTAYRGRKGLPEGGCEKEARGMSACKRNVTLKSANSLWLKVLPGNQAVNRSLLTKRR